MLAPARKLDKDVEARMTAMSFIKMSLTPEEFRLIVLYRTADNEGEARIMAAAEAARKRQDDELNIDGAGETVLMCAVATVPPRKGN